MEKTPIKEKEEAKAEEKEETKEKKEEVKAEEKEEVQEEKNAQAEEEKTHTPTTHIGEIKPAHHSKKPELGDFQATTPMLVLLGLVVVLMLFNQFQISNIGITGHSIGSGNLEISDLSQITTTSQTVALLFPVDEINSEQDAINMMISQGTPDYGVGMGISFDDPIAALELLASNYNTIKSDLKQNNPEVWERYLALATKPVGISCEYCCGVGPIGINKKGDMTCGCSHNPAIQSLTMLLMKDTNMNDAEVLREDMRWKALWFPRDMVGLALKASGGEIESALPGMVGGC